MRSFIASAAFRMIAIVSAGAAGAADLPARTYTKAPIMAAPVYNWTGFYVGANVGWSFGRSRTDVSIAGVPVSSTSQRMDGILGGPQAGYNWQSGGVVFGLETDIQATAQKGSSSLVGFIPGTPDIPGTPGVPCVLSDPPGGFCLPGTNIPPTPAIPGIPAIASVVTYQNKLPWFGTFRGRLGFTPADRWLLYVTGGLAYGEVSTSETLNVNGANVAFSTDRTKLGWTLGGGVEAALWGNWTGKLEYLYIDLGTVNNTLIGIAPITPVVSSSHITDQIVRVGVNYRFGGPFVGRP